MRMSTGASVESKAHTLILLRVADRLRGNVVGTSRFHRSRTTQCMDPFGSRAVESAGSVVQAGYGFLPAPDLEPASRGDRPGREVGGSYYVPPKKPPRQPSRIYTPHALLRSSDPNTSSSDIRYHRLGSWGHDVMQFGGGTAVLVLRITITDYGTHYTYYEGHGCERVSELVVDLKV